MLIIGTIKSNNRYLLVIHSSEEKSAKEIESTILTQYNGKAILRVSNHTKNQIEYIYEISQKMIENTKKRSINIEEVILNIEGVCRVNIVCQNEEMSR